MHWRREMDRQMVVQDEFVDVKQAKKLQLNKLKSSQASFCSLYITVTNSNNDSSYYVKCYVYINMFAKIWFHFKASCQNQRYSTSVIHSYLLPSCSEFSVASMPYLQKVVALMTKKLPSQAKPSSLPAQNATPTACPLHAETLCAAAIQATFPPPFRNATAIEQRKMGRSCLGLKPGMVCDAIDPLMEVCCEFRAV